MGYRLLVTAILALHFAFLAYVVVGGFLAIRWPPLFWPHLVAAAWGLLVVLVPVVCPLTWAENWARQRAGEPALTKGFIDRYIEGVIYPARYTRLIDVLIGLVIVGSWLLVYRRWRYRAGDPGILPSPSTDVGLSGPGFARSAGLDSPTSMPSRGGREEPGAPGAA